MNSREWLAHQSSSGCRFTTRVRLLMMNRPVGFSAVYAPLGSLASRSSGSR